MSIQQQTLKIRPDHLSRQAVIYVRQSTLLQVRENLGSTTRQYDLVKRAHELGWEPAGIEVIDQDQGQSGSSTIGRDGFQTLVAEVGLGHVGAVLSLEVSRLARSCSDWYRLLEICALTETLVIDEEGVYDPGSYNDRLLLGFKGTMSEAELHWLHQRLQGGKLTKAEQGKLRFRLPSGLCRLKPSVAVSEPECGRLWGKPLKAHHRLFYSVLKENGFRSTSLRVFLLIRPPKPHEKAKRSVAKPGFRNGHTQSKSTRRLRKALHRPPSVRIGFICSKTLERL